MPIGIRAKFKGETKSTFTIVGVLIEGGSPSGWLDALKSFEHASLEMPEASLTIEHG